MLSPFATYKCPVELSSMFSYCCLQQPIQQQQLHCMSVRTALYTTDSYVPTGIPVMFSINALMFYEKQERKRHTLKLLKKQNILDSSSSLPCTVIQETLKSAKSSPPCFTNDVMFNKRKMYPVRFFDTFPQ